MSILIFSEWNDASTNDVIDWLKELGETIIRVNQEDEVETLKADINNNKINLHIKVRGKEIHLNEIDFVWFRRGAFFINPFLEEKPHLGSNNQTISNKLIALKSAKKVGLNIPNTLISTNKSEMIDFFEDNNSNCISKGVQDILSIAINNVGYHYSTEKIIRKDLEEMDSIFFPSLLQGNIDKKYELRIFYMNEKMYAMAIFSQNDEKTKIDFRNYNWEKPNRNVPYILPKGIQEKLISFMKLMNMDTGSIDLIVTNDDKYVFLEVNPKGQYGMVSIPCGYDLDYEIATEIINNK